MSKKRRWLTCWVPHRLEMLISPAWRARPIAVNRIIDRLEEEHLRHGGLNNGELYVSYAQFQQAGVSRRVVKAALECGRDLGFIQIRQEGEGRGDVRPPNAYRLTFLPAGKSVPTDDWKSIGEDRAAAIAARFRTATGASRTSNDDESKVAQA